MQRKFETALFVPATERKAVYEQGACSFIYVNHLVPPNVAAFAEAPNPLFVVRINLSCSLPPSNDGRKVDAFNKFAFKDPQIILFERIVFALERINRINQKIFIGYSRPFDRYEMDCKAF